MGKTIISSKYQPLYTTKKRYIYLSGGRGSSKSYTVSDFAVRLSFEPGHTILYTRYTLNSAEKSIIPEFQEKIDDLGFGKYFKIRKNEIVNTTSGVKIIFLGIKGSSGNQTGRLKSIKGITTWIYDEFEEHPDERSFNTIDQSIRLKNKQNRIILISNALKKDSWQYKRFLEPVFKYGTNEFCAPLVVYDENFPNRKKILAEHHTEVIHTTYYDNYDNLNKQYLELIEAQKGTHRYDVDFLGMHYDIIEGALWDYSMFKQGSISPNKLLKIVVAVDPAVSTEEGSDLTGIIVVGKKSDDEFYVLDDKSGIYTPNQWARVACETYEQWEANEIVAEANNGGDLVESNIRNYRNDVAVRIVKASRGKQLRAEPIAALYEQGKVYHSGNFSKLEQELTTWSPELSKKSPDRLDALVWGLTRLSKRRKIFVI